MALRSVSARMVYVADDELYETEKPYVISFPVETIPGAKPTNHIFCYQDVSVIDVRSQTEQELGLEISGFSFVKSSLRCPIASFESSAFIQYQYFEDMRQLLYELFPWYTLIVFGDSVVSQPS